MKTQNKIFITPEYEKKKLISVVLSFSCQLMKISVMSQDHILVMTEKEPVTVVLRHYHIIYFEKPTNVSNISQNSDADSKI
jgi:hypothetical protein